MNSFDTRSEEVVSAFKRDKLARSAYRQVQRIIDDWELERETDRRLARVGVLVIGVLVVFAILTFGGIGPVELF